MPVPQIDPRGPRLGAWVATVVLSVVLLPGSTALLAAVALALAAALLPAASGVCLGREPYRTTHPWTVRKTTHREGAPA